MRFLKEKEKLGLATRCTGTGTLQTVAKTQDRYMN
jgi:hypothetical protein